MFKNIILACLALIMIAITYFIVSFIIEARMVLKRARNDFEKEVIDADEENSR